ncbi:hypothetical protein [Nocardioides mangrovicus]|uniref:hypothetical protein n=1 Tax=Nocardioides mangrovicus TaxID=2478913 RepID=UPI0013148AEF|nr:hypothetical protein [Nocardioides mangrovicus]
MSDTDTGIESDPGAPDAFARPRRGPSAMVRAIIAAVLVALLAAAAVFAVTGWRTHRQDETTARDRTAAVNAAEQFTLRLDAVDYKDLDGYSKRLRALLTPKMRSDFSDSFKTFTQAYQAIQISSKGSVRAAGVQDIDADSATVLVIHDVTVTTKSCVQPPYKRMSVDLRKIGGKWLVDDFKEDVSGCQGGTTSGSSSGSSSDSGSGQ